MKKEFNIMKNIIGSILIMLSLVLTLFSFGGYSGDGINTIQFIALASIALIVGYIGYKMLDIKEGR